MPPSGTPANPYTSAHYSQQNPNPYACSAGGTVEADLFLYTNIVPRVTLHHIGNVEVMLTYTHREAHTQTDR